MSEHVPIRRSASPHLHGLAEHHDAPVVPTANGLHLLLWKGFVRQSLGGVVVHPLLGRADRPMNKTKPERTSPKVSCECFERRAFLHEGEWNKALKSDICTLRSIHQVAADVTFTNYCCTCKKRRHTKVQLEWASLKTGRKVSRFSRSRCCRCGMYTIGVEQQNWNHTPLLIHRYSSAVHHCGNACSKQQRHAQYHKRPTTVESS